MITEHTPKTLRRFEQSVAEAFNAGKIRAPVHLDGGNEEPLIEIFREVREQDWVCGSWRMHYKALLKGVPTDQLMADILAGKSIALCYPEYRVISSAIVGGVIPIALGIAWAIKRSCGDGLMERGPRVWVFCGDMTARTGIYYECVQYANGYGLPIRFVTEDNGKSVCTPTKMAWGIEDYARIVDASGWSTSMKEQRYAYELPWPHAGAGKRIQF